MAGEVQLNDVAEIIMGQSPPGSTYNESGVGLPFFQGVRDFNYRHPSIRVFCSEPTRIALPGDILFSVRAPIGRVNIAEVECSIGRGLSIIRARSHADRKFIEFALRNMEQQWQVIEGGGSVFGNATRRDLATLSLPWPGNPLEREAIGYLLGALDDKIELNRKMNQTLEEMARAIFKSWFVDFDPVRAKAAGQKPSGLKPEIAALFPDSFEPSELGEIPKGWRIGPIGQMVQVLGGGTPSTKEPAYWEGGIHPFCTPKDMSSLAAPVLLATERHLTDEGLAKVSSGQLPVGTVLLSSRAPIGYLATAETPLSVKQGIIAMVCDGELPNLYVLLWTRANMDRVLANANGSTFMEISKRNFRPITAVVPSRAVLRCFMQIVEPMHQRIVSSLKQIQHLSELRDTLLPKLISGELRVPVAERIAGRCL